MFYYEPVNQNFTMARYLFRNSARNHRYKFQQTLVTIVPIVSSIEESKETLVRAILREIRRNLETCFFGGSGMSGESRRNGYRVIAAIRFPPIGGAAIKLAKFEMPKLAES